jgi:hypothetical protein
VSGASDWTIGPVIASMIERRQKLAALSESVSCSCAKRFTIRGNRSVAVMATEESVR